MFNKILKILKKIVFSSFLLYGYNLLALPINIIVPINIITILTLTLFGTPSLFALIFIHILIY